MTYESDTYGERAADQYDHLYGDFTPPPEQIVLLAALAGDTPAVEIGSGTGRVTLPLAERVPVVAVDASSEMTDQLTKKTGHLPITPVTADAAHYRHATSVDLVFACFNTFFLLASEATQRAFLTRAAEMLTAQGVVLIETFVPRPGERLPDGPHPGVFPHQQTVSLKRLAPGTTVLFAAENHQEAGEFHYNEVVLEDGALPRVLPGQMRYWQPDEIDTLATGAGLTLRERWADWNRTPYEPGTSTKHISLYQRTSHP
ncbi:class I SAM-dependent methyltransferase [Streptomyces jumonjinensis]|uniref:Class I SAM-dependent methyltransferase n=1 Tax=Streptomyces jumonjinensis TaxID=1945 RepID=A0A646KR83_STRJU|nr:class I SAM-dependent methyltransferase [Streptomyces jumonjinensis]MQT04763.1 class I SAM-dependent methyltransferase [Streptomyces jumonjinensis]